MISVYTPVICHPFPVSQRQKLLKGREQLIGNAAACSRPVQVSCQKCKARAHISDALKAAYMHTR